MKKHNISFSTRLSLYIIIVTGVLFSTSFLVYCKFTKQAIQNEVFEKSRAQLRVVTHTIDATLHGVEVAVRYNKSHIEKHLYDSLELNKTLLNLVLSDKAIYGSAIALEPNYYNSQQYYMLYANRVGDSIKVGRVGSEDYDYHTMEWYSAAKEKKAGHWSEPYVDKGAGNTVMTTYSEPLIDTKGNLIGVVTADISLEWFSQMVLSHKPYKRSYAFMLSRDAYYLVHRKKERILDQTYFEATAEMKDAQVDDIGKQMIALRSGNRTFMNDDTLSYVFYEPISRVGWSAATVSAESDVMASFNEMNVIIWITAIVSLILIFSFTTFTIRKIAQPLKSFATSAAIIAEGNFNAPLPQIKSQDEMQDLRNAFSSMQNSLKDYIKELTTTTAAHERIESELEIAKLIQIGMLPKVFPAFPRRDDIDLYAMLKPAKEVGGDLYDFFIKNEKLFFTVGDASGKGIPASLLMAVTSSLFRSVSSHISSPAKILESINNSIAENNETNMFITLFVGVLDLMTGELKYSNAGHNPPAIISNNDVHFLACEANIALGAFGGINFKEQSTTLQQDNTLFIYSDGLTEAENRELELYSEERLLNTLTNMPPKELIENVSASIAEFVNGNEQSDDLTMLAINYKQPMTKELILKNEISQISLLEDFVSSLGVDMLLETSLNLALEEAISNIILYAYPDKMSETISLRATKLENKIIFTISDYGVEFDPTVVPEADTTLPAEDRSIGGLGIFLVKKIMDVVKYERIDGKNVLTVEKNIKK